MGMMPWNLLKCLFSRRPLSFASQTGQFQRGPFSSVFHPGDLVIVHSPVAPPKGREEESKTKKERKTPLPRLTHAAQSTRRRLNERNNMCTSAFVNSSMPSQLLRRSCSAVAAMPRKRPYAQRHLQHHTRRVSSFSASSFTPTFTSAPSRAVSSTTHPSPDARTVRMIRGFPNKFQGGGNSDSSSGGGGPESGSGELWDQLVDFPCVFTFKVIGVSQGDFANDIIDSVALALEMDRKFLKTSFRDRGKYRSITLEAPVNTVQQIQDVYAAIDRDPRVKFKF